MEQTSHIRIPSDSLGPVATTDIVVTFKNSGGRHLLTHGSIEFHSMDNATSATMVIPDFPTLPGSERIVRIPVPNTLRPGQYTALGVLDFGGSEVVAGHLPVAIKP